jgi:hypothetical protein
MLIEILRVHTLKGTRASSAACWHLSVSACTVCPKAIPQKYDEFRDQYTATWRLVKIKPEEGWERAFFWAPVATWSSRKVAGSRLVLPVNQRGYRDGYHFGRGYFADLIVCS